MVILLRHDVDVSLEYALKMAKLEQKMGIRSSFFVRVRASFYDICEAINIERLTALTEMGFEIGLQEEVGRFTSDHNEAIELVRIDKAVLERILDRPVYGVATHLPKWTAIQITPEVLERAGFKYNPGEEIFNQEAIFVSDSNKCWKKYSLEEALGQSDKILANIHPVWWIAEMVDVTEMIELLRSGQ